MLIGARICQLTLLVASNRRSLAGNTLLGAAITEECVCVVVEQLEAGLVESSSKMRLGNSKTNGVGKAL